MLQKDTTTRYNDFNHLFRHDNIEMIICISVVVLIEINPIRMSFMGC